MTGVSDSESVAMKHSSEMLLPHFYLLIFNNDNLTSLCASYTVTANSEIILKGSDCLTNLASSLQAIFFYKACILKFLCHFDSSLERSNK